MLFHSYGYIIWCPPNQVLHRCNKRISDSKLSKNFFSNGIDEVCSFAFPRRRENREKARGMPSLFMNRRMWMIGFGLCSLLFLYFFCCFPAQFQSNNLNNHNSFYYSTVKLLYSNSKKLQIYFLWKKVA